MRTKKLFFISIIMVLLITGVVSAENWNSYELTDYIARFPSFLTDHDLLVIAVSEDRKDVYLLWYQDGVLFRKTAFEKTSPTWIHPLSVDNSVCRFVIERSGGTDLENDSNLGLLTLYLWRGDTPEIEKEWQLKNGDAAYDPRNGFFIISETNALNTTLTLYNCDGKALWGPETFSRDFSQDSLHFLTGNGKGVWAVDFIGETRTNNRNYILMFSEGLMVSEIGERLTNSMLPSGNLPIVKELKKTEDTSYCSLQLEIFGLDGNLLYSSTLTGENLTLGIKLVFENSFGGYELYGTAMSNSRRIYTVWHISTDAFLRQTAMEVRNLDRYRNYGARLIAQPDGTVWVFAEDYESFSHPPVLIPYSALPRTEECELRMSDVIGEKTPGCSNGI